MVSSLFQTLFQYYFKLCYSTASKLASALFQTLFQHCFKAFFSTASRHVSSLFHCFLSITIFHCLFQHCFKPCFSGLKACFIPCIKALLATGLDQSVLSLVSLLLPSGIQSSFKTCFSTFQISTFYNVTCSIFTVGKWVRQYFVCTVNLK